MKPRRDCVLFLYLQPPETSPIFTSAHLSSCTSSLLALPESSRLLASSLSESVLCLHDSPYFIRQLISPWSQQTTEFKKKKGIFCLDKFFVGWFVSVWDWNHFHLTTSWAELEVWRFAQPVINPCPVHFSIPLSTFHIRILTNMVLEKNPHAS